MSPAATKGLGDWRVRDGNHVWVRHWAGRGVAWRGVDLGASRVVWHPVLDCWYGTCQRSGRSPHGATRGEFLVRAGMQAGGQVRLGTLGHSRVCWLAITQDEGEPFDVDKSFQVLPLTRGSNLKWAADLDGGRSIGTSAGGPLSPQECEAAISQSEGP